MGAKKSVKTETFIHFLATFSSIRVFGGVVNSEKEIYVVFLKSSNFQVITSSLSFVLKDQTNQKKMLSGVNIDYDLDFLTFGNATRSLPTQGFFSL